MLYGIVATVKMNHWAFFYWIQLFQNHHLNPSFLLRNFEPDLIKESLYFGEWKEQVFRRSSGRSFIQAYYCLKLLLPTLCIYSIQ